MRQSEVTGLEVAVIGFSGRFNNRKNVNEYWQCLADGEDTLHVFDEAELNQLGISEKVYQQATYVKVKGQLAEKECFDAAFFGYTPAEASVMDPQIRIFHEIVWEGLEMAGYTPNKTNQKIGLYASASNNNLWQSLISLDPHNPLGTMATGYLADKDYLCTLVSYNLNLSGPAIFCHTACSSSLVAVHQAVRALLTGDCQLAVAGGVSSSLVFKGGYEYHENLILSPDGRCRAFDAEAKGTNSGEGGGVVVLKKYQDALRDRDTIYAIVKGTAVNNDGNDKMGYSAPSVNGQKKVIRSALKIAGVDPNTISYVETHGTGTRLGDPVEFKALQAAYNQQRQQKTPIGSVKTNIGHLDTAAGIASLIKVILMLKNKKIPVTAHFTKPNPNIDFKNSSFYVNDVLKEWESDGGKLRAGISSFGIGGTNCHLILEEPPAHLGTAGDEQTVRTINISAKSEAKVNEIKDKLADFLRSNNTTRLSDVAYTLNTGRADFKVRKSVTAHSIEDAIDKLTNVSDGKVSRLKDRNDEEDGCVFVFSGQGSQYQDMGRGLYNQYSFFKDHMDQCFALIRQHHNIPLEEELYPFALGKDNQVNETLYAQLSLFSISYSLAKLLIEWGIRPVALTGHSIGEYAGAVIAGVLTLDEAIQIIGKRAALMQLVQRGKMYAVFAREERIKEIIPEGVSIAAVNAEDLVVISGDDAAMDGFMDTLQSHELDGRRLHTSHAFHSAMMDEILDEYTAFVSGFTFKKAIIPLISNVSGGFFDKAIDAAYWSTHLRQPVRFYDGINTLVAAGYTTFLEVGPGDQLVRSIRRMELKNKKVNVVNLMRQSHDREKDVDYLINRISELWQAGRTIDWEKLYQNHTCRRISLPSYPFEKTRFPFRLNLPDLLSSLGQRIDDSKNGGDFQRWLYKPVWQQRRLDLSFSKSAEKRILLFCDDRGYADCLAKQMNARHAGFIKVRRGKEYQKISPAAYTINEQEYESYRRLVDDLKAEGHAISLVMHVFGLNDWPTAAGQLDDALAQGYLSLSFLVKALVSSGFDQDMRLRVIASETIKVNGIDAVNPLKATSLGALKVISAEHGYLKCKLIDINAEELGNKPFITEIENEIFSDDRRIAVAYRHNERYVQTVARAGENNSRKNALRNQGCYLVTGGLGGMGLSIAYDLAVKEKARLALVSRRELPPREQWNYWRLNHSPDEATSRLIARIQQMEEHGAEVAVLTADVSDPQRMKEVIAQIRDRFSTINGVIWAAGVIDFDGVIERRTTEQFIANIKCKVHGIVVLRELLNFAELDFVALFSSSGNLHYKEKFGQIAYNVANEFIDAYSQSYDGPGNVMAIDWCDWKEVGMSVEAISRKYKHINKTDITKSVLNETISGGVFPEEGIEIFRKCLATAGSQFIVSKQDLIEDFDLDAYENGGLIKPAATQPQSDQDAFERPELSTEYVEPEKPHEIALAGMCAQLFRINRIGILDDFFELGGDSLTAIQLINQIKKELNVKVSLEDFFTRPTIAALSQVIRAKQARSASATVPDRERITGQYHPLLPAQKRMLILHKLYPEQTNYNQIFIVKTDSIQVEKLRDAVQQLVQRHVVLRASFWVIDDEYRQEIHKEIPIQIEQYDLENDLEIGTVLRRYERPFDLSKAPLFRIAVVNSRSGSDFLLIDIHHIISDGISNRIFFNDLMQLYSGETLAPLPVGYLTYINYFYSLEVQNEIKEEEKYWLNRFKNYIQTTGLVLDFPRSAHDTKEGNKHQFRISADLAVRVRELVQKEGVTLFTFNLAVLYVLFNKLTGESDLVIGTTHMGRDLAGLENVMGMFIETIALRNEVDQSQTFTSFLHLVKDNVYKDFDNRQFPFEELVNKLNLPKNGSRNPLFDIVFSSDDLGYRLDYPKSEKQIQLMEREEKKVSFDLLFTFNQENDNLFFSMEYNANLFRPETIASYGRFFAYIIRQVVEDKELKLSLVQLLQPDEQKKILEGIGGRNAPPSSCGHVFLHISDAAATNADAVALVYGKNETTYAHLIRNVDKLTHYLQSECGVKPGDKVALYLSRSDYLVTAILAIVKARAVFVPIDIAFPEQRVQYILDKSEVNTLITDSDNLFNIPYFKGITFAMDVQMEMLEDSGPVPFKGELSDLAYILYTSGSTGNPKGVKVSHRSFINYLVWLNRYYFENKQGYSLPLFTSISFDFTLTSIFSPLMRGDAVLIYDDSVEVSQSLKEIFSSGIRAAKLTPAHVDMLAALQLQSTLLERVIVGGEALLMKHCSVLRGLNPNIQIYNEYGPTEATVACTAARIAGDRAITIGQAIDNSSVFVLDENLNLLPPNVPGEIYILGACLSEGYTDEKITGEKFIHTPWDENGKMYKSGDKGMFNVNNELVYLGRMLKNEQVKIRGNRIELKEIEAVFSGIEKVDQVMVAVKQLNGEDIIVGYYVADEALPERSIKSHLLRYLPKPVIPEIIIRLDALPVNVNGKLDYAALPHPNPAGSDAYVPPVNELEIRLVILWAEVLALDKDKIGLNDGFFSLGGNSLKVVQLSQKLEAELKKPIPVADLFDYDTILSFINHFFGDAGWEVAVRAAEPDEAAVNRLNIINNLKPNQA